MIDDWMKEGVWQQRALSAGMQAFSGTARMDAFQRHAAAISNAIADACSGQFQRHCCSGHAGAQRRPLTDSGSGAGSAGTQRPIYDDE